MRLEVIERDMDCGGGGGGCSVCIRDGSCEVCGVAIGGMTLVFIGPDELAPVELTNSLLMSDWVFALVATPRDRL